MLRLILNNSSSVKLLASGSFNTLPWMQGLSVPAAMRSFRLSRRTLLYLCRSRQLLFVLEKEGEERHTPDDDDRFLSQMHFLLHCPVSQPASSKLVRRECNCCNYCPYCVIYRSRFRCALFLLGGGMSRGLLRIRIWFLVLAIFPLHLSPVVQ